MSELKRRHINEVMDMFCLTKGDMNWAYVYYADDADKVIAQLKADYKEACDRLQTANLIKDEQLAETRHQKYKRCLRNAEGCKNKAWFYGEVHDRNAALTMWKWRKRWLELAEQFKEGDKCRG
jgi:hypothetical protein